MNDLTSTSTTPINLVSIWK